MSKNSISGDGIWFAGYLTIAFVVLKLTGVIAWSWLWVLSPLWFFVAFIAAALMLIFVGSLLITIGSKRG